jgi:hypothetical protein
MASNMAKRAVDLVEKQAFLCKIHRIAHISGISLV